VANRIIHTNYGLRALGRALPSLTPITVANVAVGAGVTDPDRAATGLVDERFRLPPAFVYYADSETLEVIIEVILPVTTTQFTPREVALFDSTGGCLAVGELNRFTKLPDDRMRIRMHLALPKNGLIATSSGVVGDPKRIEFAPGTLVDREFVANTMALLYNRDAVTPEVVKIESVTDSAITLTDAPTRFWPSGSRLAPLRVARFDALPQIANMTDRVGTSTARFELLENSPYEPVEDWGYCAPVFNFPLDWADSVTVSHDRNVSMVESVMGDRHIVDPGQRDRVMTRAGLKLIGREQAWAFRRFLSAARGKTVRFWAPSFTMDIEPIGAISGDSFVARDTGFTEAFVKPQDSRLMIAIVFTDGRPTLYRKLTGVVRVLTGERFYLEVPLPLIKREDIDSVQFMIPSRFDQDTFEFRHHVDDSKAVSTSVVLKSCDVTGMPVIECFTTSKPYPIHSSEMIVSGMTVTGGLLQEVAPPFAGIAPNMNVSGGQLVEPLTDMSFEPEAMDVGVSVTGGTLAASLTQITAEPDGIVVLMDVSSGQLKNALITITDEPHGLETSLSVTGGTLE